MRLLDAKRHIYWLIQQQLEQAVESREPWLFIGADVQTEADAKVIEKAALMTADWMGRRSSGDIDRKRKGPCGHCGKDCNTSGFGTARCCGELLHKKCLAAHKLVPGCRGLSEQ